MNITINKDDIHILCVADPQLTLLDIETKSDVLISFEDTLRKLLNNDVDLIVILGDFSYGDDIHYLDVIKYFYRTFDSIKIPFTLIWGNHDNQGKRSVIKRAINIFKKSEYFVFKRGNTLLGNSNFILNINRNKDKVCSLVFMDTHNKVFDRKNKNTFYWAKLTSLQRHWYRKNIKNSIKDNYPFSILFTHIPIFKYKEVMPIKEQADNIGGLPTIWEEGSINEIGINLEEVCSYKDDDHVFDDIDRFKHTKLVICGHDHNDSLGKLVNNTYLTYCLKTGKGCYYAKPLNGGSLITINKDNKLRYQHIFVPFDE